MPIVVMPNMVMLSVGLPSVIVQSVIMPSDTNLNWTKIVTGTGIAIDFFENRTRLILNQLWRQLKTIFESSELDFLFISETEGKKAQTETYVIKYL